MDPRETLARLTCHGPSWDSSGRSTDPDRLTVADIGYALGLGLKPGHARLLLAKYCDDQTEARLFKAAFFDWPTGEVPKLGWIRPKSGMIYVLAYRSAEEFLSTNRCATCNGVAELTMGQKIVTCGDCHGTGFRYPTEHDYANALGVTIQAFRAVWASRLALCRRELARMEYEALERFGEVMADE